MFAFWQGLSFEDMDHGLLYKCTRAGCGGLAVTAKAVPRCGGGGRRPTHDPAPMVRLAKAVRLVCPNCGQTSSSEAGARCLLNIDCGPMLPADSLYVLAV